jgi:DNA-binding transcriptional regulator YdaS (Cro superfamily)
MDINEITNGKLSVKDAAIAAGLTVQAVYKWERSGKVPADHVIAIARATDWQITPHDLRPDIYPHPEDGMPKEQEAA